MRIIVFWVCLILPGVIAAVVCAEEPPAGILALRDSPVEELVWWDDDRPRLTYLPYVKKLKNLKRLNLSLGFEEHRQNYPHPISDRGLEHLTRLKELRVLSLSNTAMTDAGLRQVAKLTQLRQLLGGATLS